MCSVNMRHNPCLSFFAVSCHLTVTHTHRPSAVIQEVTQHQGQQGFFCRAACWLLFFSSAVCNHLVTHSHGSNVSFIYLLITEWPQWLKAADSCHQLLTLPAAVYTLSSTSFRIEINKKKKKKHAYIPSELLQILIFFLYHSIQVPITTDI